MSGHFSGSSEVYNELPKKITRRVSLIELNSTPKALSSTGGMLLAGKIFSTIGLSSATSEPLPDKYRYVLNTVAGLQIQGRTRFAEIEPFRNDVLFQEALGLPMIYSPETIRLYLEQGVASYKEQIHTFLDAIGLYNAR